jgi:hypothetical protein
MRDLITRSLVLLAAITMIASNFTNVNHAMTAETNPLLAKWEGPFGGIPPFDRVQIALFKPALEAAMAEQLAEIDRIAKNTAAPDFENTIAGLERAGSTFDRVTTSPRSITYGRQTCRRPSFRSCNAKWRRVSPLSTIRSRKMKRSSNESTPFTIRPRKQS